MIDVFDMNLCFRSFFHVMRWMEMVYNLGLFKLDTYLIDFDLVTGCVELILK